MSRQVNVGLIGYGLGGRVFHAPFIHCVGGLKLYKVSERRAENIQHILDNYPDTIVVDDAMGILEDPQVELVVVAAPNTAHFELAALAMRKGKHVVVEKPFTITSKEADDLIAISEETGRILTVHHNRRWDSDFLTVKKVIESQILGEIVEYESHYDRFRPTVKDNWREKDGPGTGILYDLGSHLIDQAQQLFGLPDEVFAVLNNQRRDAQAVDYFDLRLRYPGLMVSLGAGMLFRDARPHYALYGTAGSFIKCGMDVQEEMLKAGRMPWNTTDWGKEPETQWGRVHSQIKGMHVQGHIESESGDYRAFYRNVLAAVLGEERLAVTPRQARNTIRIIELAQQSSAQKKWVEYRD